MIDLTEEVISLADAAKRLPRRRGSKPVHVSCIYRWTVQGCRGVVLEYTQIGGTRCTSVEALERFFERLTAQSSPSAPPSPEPASLPKHRRKAIEQAKRELAEAGY
jgi:hypothetical protein